MELEDEYEGRGENERILPKLLPALCVIHLDFQKCATERVLTYLGLVRPQTLVH